MLLGAAGCSPGSDAVWVEGRPLPVTTVPSATVGDPDRFVAAVRAQMPELALDRRDEEIADLGSAACASLKIKNRDKLLSAYGVSADQATRLRDVARSDLCP